MISLLFLVDWPSSGIHILLCFIIQSDAVVFGVASELPISEQITKSSQESSCIHRHIDSETVYWADRSRDEGKAGLLTPFSFTLGWFVCISCFTVPPVLVRPPPSHSVLSGFCFIFSLVFFSFPSRVSFICLLLYAFCILYFVQCELITKAHSCGAACLPLGLHLGPFEMDGDKHTSNYRHIQAVRSHNRADSIAWVSGSCKKILTLFHVHEFF